MKKLNLIGVLLFSGLLAACGSSSSDRSSFSSSSESVGISSDAPSSESSVSSEQNSSSGATGCLRGGVYFCDDFSAGNTDQWNLLSHSGNGTGLPNGAFDVAQDNGNSVLRFAAAQRGGELALIKPEAFAGVPGADYFVEARIRPRQNSTTGNKFLYLMARYQGAGNWYGAGLNVQNTTDSTRVEIARSIDGSINRPVQVNRPIVQGNAGASDGQWYTVRLELIGNTLSLYFNGEKVGETTDSTYTTPGLIGLYTANKSFEIDDIIVGDPANKPVQLTIEPADATWVAEAETGAYVVTVAAVQSSGEPDTFSVESSNPAVVNVSVAGDQVSLSPLTEGEALITFSSGSAPELTRQIAATITPAFVMPTATYNLDTRTVPAINATDILRDTRLRLTFDSAPTLGDAGSIRIYRASDDTVVDNISVAGEVDTLSGNGGSRILNTQQVWVDGNTLVIAPHTGVLETDTPYYVAIAEGAVTGTLSGAAFNGLGKNAGWHFTTTDVTELVEAGYLYVGTEDQSEPVDFHTVQGALNYAMSLPVDEPIGIRIYSGVYQELLYLRNKNNVTIEGESRDNVVIQYTNNNTLNPGTAPRSLFLVSNSDLLVLANLTIKNTTLIGQGGQAEALYFDSQHRMIAENTAFYSEQDTLLLKGYAWFYNSLIAGNVDFIWGGNRVALFEQSEIRTIGRSTGSGGYILQARTVNADDKGFVFLNSSLTRGPGPTGVLVPDNTIPLARSGGNSSYFDNIVFVNTRMDSHITAAGWHPSPVPNPAIATAASGWRVYNMMDLNGNPINTSNWASYSLTEQEYNEEFSSREKIFSAYNNGEGWNPQPLY